MTIEIISERLSYIKHLFYLGVQQSELNYRVAFPSILSFHDAIDMFMQLVAEKRGIVKKERDKLYLMNFFDKIPELTLKASVNKINTRRNNLKHSGQIPAPNEIEESKTITQLFFEENVSLIFGIDWSDVSFYNLITIDKVRQCLISADKFLQHGKKKEIVTVLSIAFFEILQIDPKVKINSKKFLIDHDYKLAGSFSSPIIATSIRHIENNIKGIVGSNAEKQAKIFDKRLKSAIEIYDNNFKRLEEILRILSLGIDYRKYINFKMITPRVELTQNYRLGKIDEELLTDKNIKFMFDFVFDSAMIVQNFKFQNPDK